MRLTYNYAIVMSLLIPAQFTPKKSASRTSEYRRSESRKLELDSLEALSKVGPKLRSSRLILRHGQIKDIPAILAYYRENQAHLAPFEPLKPSSFYTRSYWEELLAERLLDTQEGRSLRLFIFLREQPDVLIGTLNFNNYVRGVFQSCTLGYSLAEKTQGRGYMNEALQVGIRYIFEEVKLHRIGANYLPHNQRSANLLKRLGFSVDGYARDYLYIAGQWQDHVLASLVNPTKFG